MFGTRLSTERLHLLKNILCIRIGLIVVVTLGVACTTEEPEQVTFEPATTGGVFGDTGGADPTGGADDGVDETGAGGGGPTPLGSGQCILQPVTDVVGERWQCGGAFAMTLDADGMDPMPFSLIFGPTNQGGSTDSHQEPFVMACCGPLGAPDPFCDGLHIWACYMDMIQQMCTGIPTRLKEGIESAEIPDTKGINDLQKHLASHTQECFDFFTTQSGLGNIPPTSCPAPSSWENEIGGLEMVINETFGLTIINPSIRIDTAIVAT